MRWYTHFPMMQNPFHKQLRKTRNWSNECGSHDRQGFWTSWRSLAGLNQPKGNIYPIQVSVYNVVHMKIVETFSHIQYLERLTLSVRWSCRERLTRLIQFAPGFSLRNLVRVPFDIYSEMICKESIITPAKGTMFGCFSCFHIMATLKNDYRAHRCFWVDAIKTWYQTHTFFGVWLSFRGTFKHLMESFLVR